MNIVLAANDSYMEHLAVTLVSVLINSNADDKFKFYILSNDISNFSKKRLNILKKIKDFEIEFCDIGEDDFKDLPIKSHFPKQIYYRLRMPELIKEDKVLYLDSDIIVRKSLQDLWNIDLKGNIAAVVEDILIGNKANKNDKYRLIVESENYFNSGVMLWDLEKARQNNIAEKSIKYIQENAKKISYYDQDSLN